MAAGEPGVVGASTEASPGMASCMPVLMLTLAAPVGPGLSGLAGAALPAKAGRFGGRVGGGRVALEQAVAGSGGRGAATQEEESCGLVPGELAACSWVRRRNCWNRDGCVPGACAGRVGGTGGATSGL